MTNTPFTHTRHRARRRSWAVLPPHDEPPTTVLDYLAERFATIAREVWADRMARGLVHGVGTDGREQRITVDTPYQPNLRVSYFRETLEQPRVAGREQILYQDDHLLVVDKPPFLPVTPGGPFVNECLLYRLEATLGAAVIDPLAPAHRLDRATRGVILIVRQRAHRGAYANLFAEHRVEKVYEAWCHDAAGTYEAGTGDAEHLEPESQRLKHRMVPGEPWFRMRIDSDPGPINAITDIDLLERRPGLVRVELRPRTGKQHQLRVQLAAIGLPIVGDRFYPELLPKIADHKRLPLQLHARELRFVDPLSDEPRHFMSQLRLDDPACFIPPKDK